MTFARMHRFISRQADNKCIAFSASHAERFNVACMREIIDAFTENDPA